MSICFSSRMILDCKYKTSSRQLIGFPNDGRNIGSSIMSGRNPPLLYCTCINRHAGTPNKTKTKDTVSLDHSSIFYIGSRIGWMSKGKKSTRSHGWCRTAHS